MRWKSDKNYIAILLIAIILMSTGCNQSNEPAEKQPEVPTEEKAQIYYEDYKEDEAHLWVNITIYTDEEYEYVLGPHKKAYVEYKGEQYTYSKALDEHFVTIDDLINAGANISKREIDDSKKES